MLYTGSVNRFIFWVLVPLVLAFFLVVRVVEWRLMDDGGRQKIAEQHAINLTDRNDINCFILGGSNAAFSLSAEQVSTESDFNCYNLSLFNEGYSFSNYWEFIDSLPGEALGINHVFYSSAIPYRDDSYLYKKRQNEINGRTISGDQPFSFLGRSLASYLKYFAENGQWFKSFQCC